MIYVEIYVWSLFMWLNIFNFTKYRQLAFFPEFLYQCALTMLVYFMPTFAVIFFPTFAFLVSVKCRNMHWLSTVWNIHNNCIILWIPYWLFLTHFAFFGFFKIYLFIYLFLAVLGLRFCARAFSSCSKQGPLFIAVHGPLTIVASLVAEHRLQMRRLSSCGSRA